uniref:Late endosomal/lysosomal adaptor and MAPK and MTOR activator 5 n=1 Tax=Ditylenchus dipsaci TaxID=166011 RepID=A0A915E0Y8_9BILA
MDKRMEQCAHELTKDTDVKGLVCSDEHGAAFYCKGTLNEQSAAVVSQLASLCNSLEPTIQPTAICISSSANPTQQKSYSNVVDH